MSPSLDPATLACNPGVFKPRTSPPRADEVTLTCAACDWTAIRPAHAADSAAQAHNIAHRKGWIK